MTTLKEIHLSDQALGAIMMALQKSLLEQSDIVPTLRDMRFTESDAGLIVMNPPIVKFGYEEVDEGSAASDDTATE